MPDINVCPNCGSKEIQYKKLEQRDNSIPCRPEVSEQFCRCFSCQFVWNGKVCND